MRGTVYGIWAHRAYRVERDTDGGFGVDSVRRVTHLTEDSDAVSQVNFNDADTASVRVGTGMR